MKLTTAFGLILFGTLCQAAVLPGKNNLLDENEISNFIEIDNEIPVKLRKLKKVQILKDLPKKKDLKLAEASILNVKPQNLAHEILEPKPVEAKPLQSEPIQIKLEKPVSIDANLVPAPIQSEPSEAIPVPIEAKPAESIQPGDIHVDPNEPLPVELNPIDPNPAEPIHPLPSNSPIPLELLSALIPGPIIALNPSDFLSNLESIFKNPGPNNVAVEISGFRPPSSFNPFSLAFSQNPSNYINEIIQSIDSFASILQPMESILEQLDETPNELTFHELALLYGYNPNEVANAFKANESAAATLGQISHVTGIDPKDLVERLGSSLIGDHSQLTLTHENFARIMGVSPQDLEDMIKVKYLSGLIKAPVTIQTFAVITERSLKEVLELLKVESNGHDILSFNQLATILDLDPKNLADLLELGSQGDFRPLGVTFETLTRTFGVSLETLLTDLGVTNNDEIEKISFTLPALGALLGVDTEKLVTKLGFKIAVNNESLKNIAVTIGHLASLVEVTPVEMSAFLGLSVPVRTDLDKVAPKIRDFFEFKSVDTVLEKIQVQSYKRFQKVLGRKIKGVKMVPAAPIMQDEKILESKEEKKVKPIKNSLTTLLENFASTAEADFSKIASELEGGASDVVDKVSMAVAKMIQSLF